MCSISVDQSKAKKQQVVPSRVTVSPLVFGNIVALGVAMLWRTIPSTYNFVVAVGIMAATVIGFLTFIVLWVHFYTSGALRKASTNAGHIADLVNGAPPPEGAIADLDKMLNPEGLSHLWKEEIQGNDKTFRILLTGVTGYVGRAVLFQLLREIAKAEEDEGNNNKKLDHKIYVMARAKARKNQSANDRLELIRDEPMFAPYVKQWDDVIRAVESGDLKEDKCGMSEETINMLTDTQLTHVVHCAADVNFIRPLPESAAINISPALQLQALASEWPTCKRFVHCSTAFVHPGPGTDEEPIAEALFPLGHYDPQELYDSMQGDQQLALQFKKEFGFPNNYVVTKCVAEHLVSQHNDAKTVELRIVRPAVVGPSWVLPHQGWNGDKPSTISGVFLLWGTRVIRFAPLLNRPMPVVPVDVVAAGIIHAMIAPPAKKQAENDEYPLSIRNLIWSHKSPIEFSAGVSLAKENVEAALWFRHFSTTEAAVSFLLLDIHANFTASFHVLHTIFNLGPLCLLQFVCWAVKMTGIKTALEQVPVVKLFKFSDMLNLYQPYMGRDYKFASTIEIPESFNMHRYSAGLVKATQEFWSMMFPGTSPGLDDLDLLPKRRLDLWWSLTQPCSSFRIRMSMYFAGKILRATCNSVELNLHTVDQLFHTMVELERSMSEQKHCVVLAPTHRSVLDYILVKYITFTMVSTGLDVPLVLAKPEFDDAKLKETFERGKAYSDRHISLAMFLEGSPSTDGRIQKPREVALEKLVKLDGDHDITLIPLCMDYRATNDSEILFQATRGRSDIGLSRMFSLYWQICVLKKAKPSSLGDVRISFGVPSSLDSNADLDAVAKSLHSELERLTSHSKQKVNRAVDVLPWKL